MMNIQEYIQSNSCNEFCVSNYKYKCHSATFDSGTLTENDMKLIGNIHTHTLTFTSVQVNHLHFKYLENSSTSFLSTNLFSALTIAYSLV